MSTVRRDAVALGILFACLASWSMPVRSDEVIEDDDQSRGQRGRHAGAECAKRGLPADDYECYTRGLHDYDCRQERNPNPKDTPEACVERRMAGGPKWLAPGEVMPWKPAPASTPSAPAPASDPAPQSSDGGAMVQEDAGDVASEDGGEAVDGSGDGEASGEETSGEETSGEETSGEETSGEETSGEETSGEETSGEEASGEEASGEEASGDEAGDEAAGDDETGEDEA